MSQRLPPLDVSPARRLASFLALGGAFLIAGAVVLVGGQLLDEPLTGWLAVHLALAGGVSLLIIGAAQFFACAILATAPQPARLAAAQAVAWSLGVLTLVAAASRREPWLVAPAVVLGGLALGLFAAGLRGMQRRSLQRVTWAVRWYYACAAFAAAGGLLGGELWRGADWVPGDARTAHATLMLMGWCGTAIVGTIHTLLPTMAGRRLALPALQRPTFIAWTAGVALLSCGFLLGAWPMIGAGAMAVDTAALLLLANVVRTAGVRPRGAPAQLLVLGQASLVLGTTLGAALAASLPAAGGEMAAWRLPVALLAAGWVGSTVAGSLLHLARVVARALSAA